MSNLRREKILHRLDAILITILFVFSLVALVGCNNPFNNYVHIHDRYPVYDTPEKTVLPKISKEQLEPLDEETKKQVLKAVKDLKSEAAQLRAKLDSYNAYAERKNAEYDQLFRRKN